MSRIQLTDSGGLLSKERRQQLHLCHADEQPACLFVLKFVIVLLVISLLIQSTTSQSLQCSGSPVGRACGDVAGESTCFIFHYCANKNSTLQVHCPFTHSGKAAGEDICWRSTLDPSVLLPQNLTVKEAYERGIIDLTAFMSQAPFLPLCRIVLHTTTQAKNCSRHTPPRLEKIKVIPRLSDNVLHVEQGAAVNITVADIQEQVQQSNPVPLKVNKICQFVDDTSLGCKDYDEEGESQIRLLLQKAHTHIAKVRTVTVVLTDTFLPKKIGGVYQLLLNVTPVQQNKNDFQEVTGQTSASTSISSTSREAGEGTNKDNQSAGTLIIAVVCVAAAGVIAILIIVLVLRHRRQRQSRSQSRSQSWRQSWRQSQRQIRRASNGGPSIPKQKSSAPLSESTDYSILPLTGSPTPDPLAIDDPRQEETTSLPTAANRTMGDHQGAVDDTAYAHALDIDDHQQQQQQLQQQLDKVSSPNELRKFLKQNSHKVIDRSNSQMCHRLAKEFAFIWINVAFELGVRKRDIDKVIDNKRLKDSHDCAHEMLYNACQKWHGLTFGDLEKAFRMALCFDAKTLAGKDFLPERSVCLSEVSDKHMNRLAQWCGTDYSKLAISFELSEEDLRAVETDFESRRGNTHGRAREVLYLIQTSCSHSNVAVGKVLDSIAEARMSAKIAC